MLALLHVLPVLRYLQVLPLRAHQKTEKILIHLLDQFRLLRSDVTWGVFQVLEAQWYQLVRFEVQTLLLTISNSFMAMTTQNIVNGTLCWKNHLTAKSAKNSQNPN